MDRSVLVTGGSRGIGAAIVGEFAGKGYKTAFLYKSNRVCAEKVSGETGALALRCDVSDPGQVRSAVKAARTYLGLPYFRTLICSAGISRTGLFTDMAESEWKEVFDVDLNGCVYVLKEALPAMISNRDGSIVMVSSVWGQTGASCEAAYSAAKAAVIGLTKSLAKEAGPSGVRVNCVAPGIIDTEMNSCHSKETMENLCEEVPLGRIGLAAEVAKAVFFLASEEASYITGQVLGVNGGFYI